MVWDFGTYENAHPEKKMQDAYEEGHISINLHGKKLKGGFALIRARFGRGNNQWLLLKKVRRSTIVRHRFSIPEVNHSRIPARFSLCRATTKRVQV
jgi:hypothetical protein